MGEGGGGGNSTTFQITQQLSNISRCFFHTEVCVSFLSLLQCQIVLISFLRAVRRKMVSYIVRRAYKRAPKLVASPQLTTLHSTGDISGGQCIQEQSRPQQHTWNSKLFVIFPAEITAAQSLHFQHLMWTKVMSSRLYSKKKPFVSNVHINILMNISL